MNVDLEHSFLSARMSMFPPMDSSKSTLSPWAAGDNPDNLQFCEDGQRRVFNAL